MIVNLKEQHCENFLQSLHKEQWQEVRLGEVAEINPKETLRKHYLYKKVAMDNLEPYTKKVYSFGIESFNGGAKFRNGDTLLARITPCLENGKTAFVDFLQDDEIAFGSTEFIVLREKTTISDKDFLYYLARSKHFREVAIKSMTGSSGRERVQIEVLRDFTFLLPPLTIQQKIAEILSSFDDKIDLLHRQNKTLESLALTLFRHYFIDNPKRDEWEEVSLNSLCEITSSKRIFYSEYVEYGIPFYRSKEIIEFSKGNNPQNELFIDENKYNDIANKFGVPQANDILLTSVGTLGIPYLVPKDKKFYFKDGNLTWFKNFKNITSLFLFYWFKSPQGKEKLDSIAIGSTQQALTIAALKAVNIHLPHTDIIRILNEQLNGIQNKIENNTKQIQNLQAMRDIMLKAIFKEGE